MRQHLKWYLNVTASNFVTNSIHMQNILKKCILLGFVSLRKKNNSSLLLLLNTCKLNVTEALWMEGVRSWACHIQTIRAPSYGLRNCSSNSGGKKKKLLTNEILAHAKPTLASWRGWLFVPSYENMCLGSVKVAEGFPKLLKLFYQL
jgi:hypothetical protein